MTTYETDLLNIRWWIDSLFGNPFLLLAVVEIWMLSFIRKIPNITTYSIILFAINILVLIFGFMSGAGLTLSTGLLAFVCLIYGYLAWSNYENS